MKFSLCVMFMLFFSGVVYADPELDNFFSDLPKNVLVTKVECTIDGRIVDPWRLDSFNIRKVSDLWNVNLVVDGTSVSKRISPEYGEYRLSQTPGEKRLDMIFYRGPAMSLIFSNSTLELDQVYVSQQFPGPDLVRKCVYR